MNFADRVFTFQVAETAAALADIIAGDPEWHERFYDLRRSVDGMVGMWTSCAEVALVAQVMIAPLWPDGHPRDFITDVHNLASFMVTWQEENEALEYPKQAQELVEAFLEQYPTK